VDDVNHIRTVIVRPIEGTDLTYAQLPDDFFVGDDIEATMDAIAPNPAPGLLWDTQPINPDKFEVFYDKTTVLDPMGPVPPASYKRLPSHRIVKISIPMNEILLFEDDGFTNSRPLLLCTWCVQPRLGVSIAGSQYTMKFTSRIYYADLV